MILIQLLGILTASGAIFRREWLQSLQLASIAIAPRIIMSRAVPSDRLDSEVQTNQAEDETFQVLQKNEKGKKSENDGKCF